jgi:hypothetical protein
VEDVKKQHFKIDERQKISAARKIGEKEDQAGDLQGGPMVRGRSDVDRNCRASKGFAACTGVHAARKGWRRLK